MSESTVNKTFRMKLYNWRMANNLTQREAAEALGCYQNQIWRWEQGEQQPRSKTLAKLLPIIEAIPDPAPEQVPVEEPWVPEPVETKRPKTFRERMEQRYGGMEEYFQKTKEVSERGYSLDAYEAEPEVEVIAELPLEAPTKPSPSMVNLAEVIGFLKCLALYASEGVAEPLEQQIKTLQDIAEEMSA